MLRTRLFGLVALVIVVALAGCRHGGGCPSCSRSAPAVAPAPAGCTSCAAHAPAPIPAPIDTGSIR